MNSTDYKVAVHNANAGFARALALNIRMYATRPCLFTEAEKAENKQELSNIVAGGFVEPELIELKGKIEGLYMVRGDLPRDVFDNHIDTLIDDLSERAKKLRYR